MCGSITPLHFFFNGEGWPGVFPSCARPTRGVHDRALRGHRGLSGSIPSSTLHIDQRERPRLPFTARIERAHSYRARSASKKGTWPLPPHPLSHILVAVKATLSYELVW